MTTLAAFIEQAWNDHVSDLDGVAARVKDGLELLDASPDQLGNYLQMAEHMHLAHFGDTDAMQDVLDKVAPTLARQADARLFADRASLVMLLLREQPTGDVGLPVPATVRAHGSAVNGFISRGEFAKARSLLQAAASLARDAAADVRTDALKALAAGYNNVASQVLDLPRSPEGDALMLEAAVLSRSTWGEVGNWMNAERAEYRLAVCASATGDGKRAVEHARACAQICESNGADAFETFFAHEAMARALLVLGDRAAADEQAQRMQRRLSEIADGGNRAYAADTLDKLQVSMSA